MTQIRKSPLGYAQFTVAGSAVALGTAAMTNPAGTAPPSGTEFCLIQPETNAIRFQDAGGTPSASVGFPVAALGAVEYDGNPATLRFIAQSGTATVNILFYGGSGGFSA
jgi:hypothetical protein